MKTTVEVVYRGGGVQGDIRYQTNDSSPMNRFMDGVSCLQVALYLRGWLSPDMDLPGDYERALSDKAAFFKRLDKWETDVKDGKPGVL